MKFKLENTFKDVVEVLKNEQFEMIRSLGYKQYNETALYKTYLVL